MLEYLQLSPAAWAAIIVLAVWSAVWKLCALWKAARKGSLAWFIVLGIINTAGILEILYIFIFSEMGKKRYSSPVKAKKTKYRR